MITYKTLIQIATAAGDSLSAHIATDVGDSQLT